MSVTSNHRYHQCFLSFFPYLTEFPAISPMICGIWAGQSKPVLNEYIQSLVNELNTIMINGIFIKSYHVTIKFGRVLADTPARSLIKGVYLL